jgi:hypothetical protein
MGQTVGIYKILVRKPYMKKHLLLLLLRTRQLKLWKHLSLEAYCATLNCHSAQIQYTCVSYKETEVPE